ncbi:subtilisin-like protease SBT5.3 [Aristolochia californica]|uniref:subtilisin-like protease SBT5.3 n=1 Tax=Aristolochia californica TaxID=171875 RepID=UPI0035E07D85
MSSELELCLYWLFLFSLLKSPISSTAKNSYIVYLGAHSHGPNPSSSEFVKVTDSHFDFLGGFIGSKDKARDSIFYSYTKTINGFAAVLEEEEAEKIARHPDVVSVFPNEAVKLQTTRSWEFLGLEEGGRVPSSSLWVTARYGADVIIGNLDTGVWSESESFNDDGLGDVPAKWKGECQAGVTCNRKLIGARYYNKGFVVGGGATADDDYSSVRDYNGHGTHTLSTAAGSPVNSANIFGYANGTARGGSPGARVATYKVCYGGGVCYNADILAGFDDAIHDGVDVLSVSLGGFPLPYLRDSIAIGSFHAAYNNIPVVASAGNDGPYTGSVSNVSPWMFTVAASTMDRRISSDVVLDGGEMFSGQSLSTAVLESGTLYPIVYAVDAKREGVSDSEAAFCLRETLDEEKAKGKIVVCIAGLGVNVESGEVVGLAGGVGMVLVEGPVQEITAQAHVIPATAISRRDGRVLVGYVRGGNSTVAGTISRPVTVVRTTPAPVMAGFSSRGPNSITAEILKPDITAPGVNVLAATTQGISPTGLHNDSRRVSFSMLSGTSMSCPHIAGVAGLLKTLHPQWSPAAIRSALMTTATTRDNAGSTIQNITSLEDNPFGYGAGHVCPNAAMDPGLIYDLNPVHYLDFLCAVGYNATQIGAFTNDSYTCEPSSVNLLNFNYPSITVPNLVGSVTVSRTVKIVSSSGKYTAVIEAPPGVLVSVEPTILKFEMIGEEQTFNVTLQAQSAGGGGGDYVFGKLIWTDGMHYVRSPIVVNVVAS